MVSIDGLLVVDKPPGPSSFDVVRQIRRLLGRRIRVGHAGTLDPFACGVLVLGIGRATRLLCFLAEVDKTYRARARLGRITDSHDPTGKTLRVQDGPFPGEEAVRQALDGFRGKFLQVPPMFSAKKVSGKRLYEMARAGQVIERAAVPVMIHELELESYEEPDCVLRIRCSKGTYIRSLVHELGLALGPGAICQELRRLSVGPFQGSQAVDLDVFRGRNDLEGRLVAMIDALPEWPVLCPREEDRLRLIQGQAVPRECLPGLVFEDGERVRIVDENGELLALARWGVSALEPFRVFAH